MYAGSFYAGDLFKSVDGGATWQRRKFGSVSVYVWMPVVYPIEPNIVYAGTQGDDLWKSIDYGALEWLLARITEWNALEGCRPRGVPRRSGPRHSD